VPEVGDLGGPSRNQGVRDGLQSCVGKVDRRLGGRRGREDPVGGRKRRQHEAAERQRRCALEDVAA
jgi:hypothetical protein